MEIKVYSRGVHNLYFRGLRAVVQLGQDCSTLADVLHHWHWSLQLPLSDETKNFHRDRYRDFISRPKFLRLRLFFETKYFRDRYQDFFSRPNIFETDTETFFRDQNFQDRDRYSQKIEKSLDTEKSWDEMSHSGQNIIFQDLFRDTPLEHICIFAKKIGSA